MLTVELSLNFKFKKKTLAYGFVFKKIEQIPIKNSIILRYE